MEEINVSAIQHSEIVNYKYLYPASSADVACFHTPYKGCLHWGQTSGNIDCFGLVVCEYIQLRIFSTRIVSLKGERALGP